MSKADYKVITAKNTIKRMPFSHELNFADIRSRVFDIMSACADVQWADDQLDDILGEELATEFRMQYSDLESACEQFTDEAEEYSFVWTLEGEEPGASHFDALIAGSGGTDDLVWAGDGGASEYTPIDSWSREYAERMAGSRIKRLTKDKIIELMGDALWVLRSYWDITGRYTLLSGIFELIHEEAYEELDAVKGVEAAWAAWDADKSLKLSDELDKACRDMPAKVWLT